MHPRGLENRHSAPNGEEMPSVPLHARPASHHRDGKLSNNLYSEQTETVAAVANIVPLSAVAQQPVSSKPQRLKTLYTPEERIRRDATKWTLVQGILAPVQFVVFLVSLALVVRYLREGEGFFTASVSIVIKTLLLYAIMITGSIWEREVFGCYLFAPAFFWEDVFSFLVLALHTAYLVALLGGIGEPRQQMLLALTAYASYVVNATQFILKLRAARRDERVALSSAASVAGSRG
ncbi:2-vinyl bacteriochlorophyllide hydratase [Bradyrhizobium sp.]|uniref:2-vinyl bacteriochlorophyllide hydratase n=1 Tax=Bradyrhizobium sp. TaxID=376 RepID=UPI000AC29673